MKFVMKFIHLLTSFLKSPLSTGRDLVRAPIASTNPVADRSQQPRLLQAMQQRIQCPGSDAITVVLQLFHHLEAKDRLLRCMKQHMNPYQTVEQFPLLVRH